MKWLTMLFLYAIAEFTSGCSGMVGHGGLLAYIDPTGRQRAVNTMAEWGIRQGQIHDSLQAVMGKLPDTTHLPPMDIKYLDSLKENHYLRYTIRFTVADKEYLPAYLYVPIQTGITRKLPAMLALHPTGALGKQLVDGKGSLPNRAYGKELAERGYVVIAPDYPGFGDLKDYDFKADRYQSGTMKNIFDDMRCVDLLQQRSDVDPARIGVIGHSLGGHSAMFVGAFDKRLRVIVSSCGWTLLHDYFNGDEKAAKLQGGKLWPWAQARYMPLFRDQYNLNPDMIPFDFDEIIAALAPRAFFSNSPLYDENFDVKGVKTGILQASKVYHFLRADSNLQVRYPASKHDFPPKVRLEAYRFIDKILQHQPTGHAQIR